MRRPGPGAPATGGSRWLAIAAVVLAGMSSAAQIGKVPASMTTIAAEFGLGLGQAALLVALFGMLAGFGGLAIGLAAARMSPRAALLGGLATGALAAVAAAMAPAPALLFGARIAEGAGFLLVSVTAPSIIATLAAARDRSFAMSLWGTYMPTGVAIGMLSAPLVEWAGWRVGWMACAGLVLAALLLCWLVVPDARAAVTAPPLRAGAQLRALVAARKPLRVAAAFAAYNLIYMTIASFLPAYLESLGARTGAAGGAGAAAAAGNAVGNLAAGVLMARGFAPQRLMAVGALCMGGLAASVFVVPVPALSVALAVAASTVGGLVPACSFALLPRLVPRSALVAPSIGLIIQGNNLVQLVAPPLLGAVAGIAWPLLGVPLLVAGLMASVLAHGLRTIPHGP